MWDNVEDFIDSLNEGVSDISSSIHNPEPDARDSKSLKSLLATLVCGTEDVDGVLGQFAENVVQENDSDPLVNSVYVEAYDALVAYEELTAFKT